MIDYPEDRRRLNWKVGVTAIVVSLLLHQAVFFVLDLLGAFREPATEKRMEITLREEPRRQAPQKKADEDPKPETPQTPPAPTPRPRRTQPAPSTPPPPVPDNTPVPEEEPLPIPTAPTIATAPDPLPPSPQKLETRLNWGAFERTMGETAAADRIAYRDSLMEKRGGSFQFGKMSAKVQKALNDHRSWVAGAPQEPPGTKSATFRQYLDATHEQIHTLFADSFLPSLISLGAAHPLNDFSLMTLVEFQILENGIINEVHVLRTSGQAVFDAGAVDSLYRASPFLPPPESILSYDRRVYFRWGFYRNQRKCGTFNATGYILTGPAAAPVPIPEDRYSIIDG